MLFLDLAKVAALIEPAVTVEDFIGAMDGILRLQTTFLISPQDASLQLTISKRFLHSKFIFLQFARGRLQNIETKSGLTKTDCFLIGYWALNEKKVLSVSIEWIVQALRMFLQREHDESTEMIPIELVRETLRDAIEMVTKTKACSNKFSINFDTNLAQ